MNDDLIVAAYVVISEVMRALDHRSHCLAHISDAEVLTVAVVAAKYFANNHERALLVMQGMWATWRGRAEPRASTAACTR